MESGAPGHNPLDKISGFSEGPLAPTGETEEEEVKAARAANLFDVRRLIGALFVLYGIVLVVVGLVGSSHVKHQAAGVNIDLWAGLGMLVFGILMLVWGFVRPVQPEPPDTRGRGSGRIRRAPAT
jgi:hypothetical protein